MCVYVYVAPFPLLALLRRLLRYFSLSCLFPFSVYIAGLCISSLFVVPESHLGSTYVFRFLLPRASFLTLALSSFVFEFPRSISFRFFRNLSSLACLSCSILPQSSNCVPSFFVYISYYRFASRCPTVLRRSFIWIYCALITLYVKRKITYIYNFI